MIELIHSLLENQLVQAAIVLVGAALVYFIFARIVRKIILGPLRKAKNPKRERRGKTYVTAINSFARYAIAIVALLMILQIFGVDISSMIAGLGVVGIIVGFALKDSLSDIVMGKNILTDNSFNVGDVIQFEGNTGKVTRIGLRRTEIRDIYNDERVVISNRNIENIVVLGGWFDITLQTPYEKTYEEMQPVIDEMIKQFKELDHVKDATCRGIKKFDDSSINYILRIFCRPENSPQLTYDANAIVKKTLDKHNISIPYNQLDVHLVK